MREASILFFCILAVAASTFAQQVDVQKLDATFKSDLETAPCKNSDRLKAVKELFVRHGATEADMRIDKFKNVENLVLSKKGKTEEIVVIGAHYDKVDAGCGILDNWSGISILATVYEALSKTETQKTYIFVAFGEEEVGLKGSDAMVKAIPKTDKAKYCSMVNLDSFGLGYIVILQGASSPKMIKAATDVGTRLKVPVTPIDVPGANADSSSFKKNDIPGITLSALSDKWPQVMHSANDKLENILVPSVRVGYLFVSEYLKGVDAAGCADYR